MDYFNQQTIEVVSEEIHKIWISWAEEVQKTEPGLSLNRQKRWEDECFKPYSELSETMKDLDRKFAIRILTALYKRKEIL